MVSDTKDTGLYYDEYLKQVIDVLETDQHFREKLQKADIEEIRVSRVQQQAWQKNHTEKWIGWVDLCCYITER